MARPTDHIALANKNHDVLQHLLQDHKRFPEWITVLAFYKSLQIIDALCIECRYTPSGHNDRLQILLRRKEWQPLYKPFRALWAASCVARYLYDTGTNTPYSQFSDFVTPDKVVAEMVGSRLVTVEQIALSRLSPSLKSSLVQTDLGSLPKP